MICRYIWIIHYIFSFLTSLWRIITQANCRSWSQNEGWTEQLSGFFAMTSYVLPAKQIGHSHLSTQAQGEADPHSLSSVLPALTSQTPLKPGAEPWCTTCRLTAEHSCPDVPSASTWAGHKHTAHGHEVCTGLLCTVCIWNQQVYFPFLFTVSGWEHLVSQQLLQHPLLQAGRHLGHWVIPPQFKEEILMVCSWAPHNRQE